LTNSPAEFYQTFRGKLWALLIVNFDGDALEEYGKLWRVLAERTVTTKSADLPYCTRVVNDTLRRKNQWMQSGHVEKAGTIALKISEAITNFNSAELSRVDVLCDSHSMWSKVRRLAERSKSLSAAS
jgi:hypothetical protein